MRVIMMDLIIHVYNVLTNVNRIIINFIKKKNFKFKF